MLYLLVPQNRKKIQMNFNAEVFVTNDYRTHLNAFNLVIFTMIENNVIN